jgi:sugar phosphate isomerase/epimerase
MPAPIALQLYTLREAVERDGYEAVVRRVADMGYVGVEPAGFSGTTPAAAAHLFADLGLQIAGIHAGLPTDEKKGEILDLVGTLGVKRFGCAWLPPENFETVDGVQRVCEQLNEAAQFASENSLRFYYHNHWFEYRQIDGQPVHHIMLQHLNPDVELEIDTYWVKTGGEDPVTVLKEVGNRATLLHVKDGPADDKDSPMVAVGSGTLDWHSIIPAASSAEWLIVELDRSVSDMYEAVQNSYTYLVNEGLARGNR